MWSDFPAPPLPVADLLSGFQVFDDHQVCECTHSCFSVSAPKFLGIAWQDRDRNQFVPTRNLDPEGVLLYTGVFAQQY